MKPFEKVVFLDFDGPLINDRTAMTYGGLDEGADPVLVNLLRRAGMTGIKLVISSDRRTQVEKTFGFLDDLGLRKFLHDDWCTPVLPSPYFGDADPVGDEDYDAWLTTRRGSEIDAWLKKHPEVRLYRIVDDDPAMLPGQMPWFVKCDTHDGLGSSEMKFLWQFIINAENENQQKT